MRLTRAGYAWLAFRLAQLADRHADGRLVAVTEGGYDLGALGESLEAMAAVFADTLAPTGDLGRLTGRGATAVAAVRAVQSPRWRGL